MTENVETISVAFVATVAFSECRKGELISMHYYARENSIHLVIRSNGRKAQEGEKIQL